MDKQKLSVHKDNFKRWFENSIDLLSKTGFSGIPILMITFPLLERLNKDKKKNFFNKLSQMFNLESSFEAEVFWKVFRNGLLHAATFMNDFMIGKKLNKQQIHIDECGISESLDRAISIDKVCSEKGKFKFKIFVNPSMFSKKVLEIVDEQFEKFCEIDRDKGGLPEVIPFEMANMQCGNDNQNSGMSKCGYSGYLSNNNENIEVEDVPGHSDYFSKN